jgi:sequestosome 1
MSAQQIIVKAYYNDLVENQPEIRRFALDVSPTNDVYRALETTIAQLNSDYPQGQFTLQYVDEDNDRITFSSDSELRSALNNIAPGGVIKIYVKPKAKKTEETGENPTVHVGITCDGCQGPVIGNRYKCTQCPDYDLCQACSDKKVHPDHNMIKITRPWQRFWGGHRRCGRGPFGAGPFGGRGPSGAGPFGGRCPRFWHHFMRQQQQGGGAEFQMPANMFNFLSQYKGKELAELIEAYLPEYLRTEKIIEILNQFKTGEQAEKLVDQNTLLENVGAFLREILSPFGIDCDYFVDKQQTTKPTEQPQPETKEETEEATASSNTSTEPKPSAAPKPETASASASAAAPSFGNLLDQLQTMFGPILQPPTAPPTTSSAADQQAQEQKKIDECIERMTAMGFVDTNGVLSELIKSKKGDLNQVLDALNPRNYKN